MAAFSYQYHPFLVDSSFFFPNTPTTTKMSSSFEEQAHINTCPSPQFPLHQEASSVVTNQDTISCVDQSSKVTISYTDPSPFVTQNHSPETSMVVDKLENGEQVTQNVITTPMDNKKRKTINGSSLNDNSPQSKDSTEGRNKRQKKSNGGVKGEDKPKEEKKDKKKGPDEEPPTGYIHVRARRGQATDSHSLAERVRREKISERMKMLQRLVPGCDKVTGKALVLDEIINYVQSLQNQVEFLSMKLASLSPLFLDLAMDMDTHLVRPDQKLNSIPPSVPQCSPSLATTFADTTTMTTSFPASNDYLLDYSSPVFLQGQRSNVFSEYTGGQFWDGEDQRQKLLHHPYGFGNNLCSLN